MTDGKNINIEALRKTLLENRTELQRLSFRSAESRDAVELDQTRQGRLSRMDAMQQQEMAKETERRRQIDIQRIDAALKRMEGDNYGYCLKCEEEIDPKRIFLDPAMSLCINCAAKQGG